MNTKTKGMLISKTFQHLQFKNTLTHQSNKQENKQKREQEY